MRMCTMAMWLIIKLYQRRLHSRSDGRSLVGVAATPTMLQSLSASAFQPYDGRRVGVSELSYPGKGAELGLLEDFEGIALSEQPFDGCGEGGVQLVDALQ